MTIKAQQNPRITHVRFYVKKQIGDSYNRFHVDECERKCSMDVKCRGFDFFISTGQCKMRNGDVANNNSDEVTFGTTTTNGTQNGRFLQLIPELEALADLLRQQYSTFA
ncbi:hypothetical protein ACOME3_006014 [Neoechinorhynchus agilis]